MTVTNVALTPKTWPAFKDPDDYKDYGRDWTKTIGADIIVSSTWDVEEGPDNSLILDQLSYTDTLAIVWINGGVIGDYVLRNSIVTQGGRKFDRSVRLLVREL